MLLQFSHFRNIEYSTFCELIGLSFKLSTICGVVNIPSLQRLSHSLSWTACPCSPAKCGRTTAVRARTALKLISTFQRRSTVAVFVATTQLCWLDSTQIELKLKSALAIIESTLTSNTNSGPKEWKIFVSRKLNLWLMKENCYSRVLVVINRRFNFLQYHIDFQLKISNTLKFSHITWARNVSHSLCHNLRIFIKCLATLIVSYHVQL